jgi:hypothetical protein
MVTVLTSMLVLEEWAVLAWVWAGSRTFSPLGV